MDTIQDLIGFITGGIMLIGIAFLFLRWVWKDKPIKLDDHESHE